MWRAEDEVAPPCPGRDAAVLDDHLKLYAHYDAELRAHQTDHVVTGGVRYSW